MTEFCFSTPRIIMQRCFASITTADAGRMQRFHQGIGNLNGQLLLDLQTTRENIHNPRDLGKADDFAIRDVGDVRPADERQQMMLAHRIELDVLDQNDLARIGIEDGAINNLIEIWR